MKKRREEGENEDGADIYRRVIHDTVNPSRIRGFENIREPVKEGE